MTCSSYCEPPNELHPACPRCRCGSALWFGNHARGGHTLFPALTRHWENWFYVLWCALIWLCVCARLRFECLDLHLLLEGSVVHLCARVFQLFRIPAAKNWTSALEWDLPATAELQGPVFAAPAPVRKGRKAKSREKASDWNWGRCGNVQRVHCLYSILWVCPCIHTNDIMWCLDFEILISETWKRFLC